MKFICNQQTLIKALNIVSKAVSVRTTLPVLKGILLEVTPDNKLKLSASDLNISIEETIDVLDGTSGKTVVVAKLFSEIIRKLPNAPVTITLDGNHVKIKCMNSDFNIVAISPDEFPNIVNDKAVEEKITLPKESLKEMIKQTAYAASMDEGKGNISGINVEMTDNKLILAALDGYRMAVARQDISSAVENSIIIDAKIMNELNRILNEVDEENLDLYINEKSTTFIVGNIKVTTRLLAGQFINYRDLLPKDGEVVVEVNRNSFIESIERASLFTSDGKKIIKLLITDSDITITSKSEEGNIVENLLVEKQGKDLEIGFNAEYLMAALKSIENESVKLLMNGSIKPLLIQPIEGDGFDALVLPVRLGNSF